MQRESEAEGKEAEKGQKWKAQALILSAPPLKGTRRPGPRGAEARLHVAKPPWKSDRTRKWLLAPLGPVCVCKCVCVCVSECVCVCV